LKSHTNNKRNKYSKYGGQAEAVHNISFYPLSTEGMSAYQDRNKQ